MRGRGADLFFQSIRSGGSRAALLGAALLCAISAAGCASLSALTGIDEDGPTGSIAPTREAPLDAFVAPGDQSAVLTAIGAALDPQGPGQPVDWSSAGKRVGEVKPLALAKPEGDEICRPFAAEGLGPSGRFEAQGVACRNKRGDWRVREMGPRKSA
jgi:surface antigen